MLSASELAKEAKGELTLTNEQAESFLNNALGIIVSKVASGEEVRLLGFGTFSLKHTKERQSMNPATRTMMTVPAKALPKFKPHTKFKDTTNAATPAPVAKTAKGAKKK